jgi:serine/threonine protein kinase
LKHLHTNDVMHCDVKPENVLVKTTSMHLYLFDMGLACEGDRDAEVFLTC